MRIAIISDIHEDITNLKKIIKLIELSNCDEIICLGDICGFSIPYYTYHHSRNASQCIDLIESNCKYSCIGNHDLYAIKKLPINCYSFNYPKNWYDLSYFERHELANNEVWLYEENELTALLSRKNIDYLRNLPEYITTEIDGIKIMFSHFLFPDLTGCTKKFIDNREGFDTHKSFMDKEGIKLSVFGHMHPSGIVYCTDNYFGMTRKVLNLDNSIKGLSIPCVSSNERDSGFTIIDTKNMTVQTILLRKSWKLL